MLEKKILATRPADLSLTNNPLRPCHFQVHYYLNGQNKFDSELGNHDRRKPAGLRYSPQFKGYLVLDAVGRQFDTTKLPSDASSNPNACKLAKKFFGLAYHDDSESLKLPGRFKA